MGISQSTHIFSRYFTIITECLSALVAQQLLPSDILSLVDSVSVEPPKEKDKGDISTNAAMVLCKVAAKSPRDLATLLVTQLDKQKEKWGIERIEIAGPGFINFFLDSQIWLDELFEIVDQGSSYGKSDVGKKQHVNVEFISANPTGPLHAAHLRGAVFGDTLCSLMSFVGYKVTREFFINDSGSQIETLARSLHLRYRQALGEGNITIPEGLYPGEYLIDVAHKLKDQDGDKWIGKAEVEWLDYFCDFATQTLMHEIKEDIDRLGIKMDLYTSEKELVKAGAVEKAFKVLEDEGLTYQGVLEPPKGQVLEDWEPRPQTLFKATQFGDDVDRAFKKSDDTWTYFAKDIAYHYDKYRRAATHETDQVQLIDVLGADHGGYVKRIKAATQAVTKSKAEVDVKICQIVKLLNDGEIVKMSKRAGTFITAKDVMDQVGKDVIKFIMLTRKNDQTLDFDFKKVTQASKENPVYYVQYAYARCSSVLRHVQELGQVNPEDIESLKKAQLSLLNSTDFLEVAKLIASWPRYVEAAAKAHEPHRIAFFMIDLAAMFHALWNKGREETILRFIHENDSSLTLSRMVLIKALSFVFESGFSLLGIDAKKEM